MGFPWLQSWNCYGASIFPTLDPFFSFLFFSYLLAFLLVHSLAFFLHSFCFLASLHHLLDFRWLGRFSFLFPDFLEIISLLMIPIFTLY